MADAAVEAFETAFEAAVDSPDKRFIRGIPFLLLTHQGAVYGSLVFHDLRRLTGTARRTPPAVRFTALSD